MGVRFALIIAILGVGKIANAQGTPTTLGINASTRPFPSADFVLRDAHHKEQKSGVQLGPRGQLTIVSGVGTPTVINALTFSGDGKILAAGKDFRRIALWDSSARKFLRAIDTNQGNVNAIALSADGKTVATGGSGDNYSVKIWGTSGGDLLWTFTEPRTPIQKLLFDVDGKWLIVEDTSSGVFIVNTGDHKTGVKLPTIHAVCMSHDGRTLVTTDGKEFAAWTAPEWTKTQSAPMSKSSSLLLASNLGADQLALYESRSIRVAQFSSGQLTLDRRDLVPQDFTWRPTFGEFSTEGLLYLSLDGHLLVVDVRRNQVCSGPQMYSGAGALSRDGRWFAGSKDDSILSKERTDGVWVWSTDRLLDKCGLNSSSKAQAK